MTQGKRLSPYELSGLTYTTPQVVLDHITALEDEIAELRQDLLRMTNWNDENSDHAQRILITRNSLRQQLETAKEREGKLLKRLEKYENT